jgi:hypothetical protein
MRIIAYLLLAMLAISAPALADQGKKAPVSTGPASLSPSPPLLHGIYTVSPSDLAVHCAPFGNNPVRPYVC